MAPYKVILAYDGTDFSGFQRQASGRTVQASVELALRNIGWKDDSIIGAGRTDSGVHASGQVVGFEHDWQHTSEDLRDALNANLPADISTLAVERVDEGFHPRYSAVARCYTYRVFCDRVRQPLKERYAWRVWPPVSLDKLQAVAGKLIGEHDFSAFGSPLKPGGSTIRKIFNASWRYDQDYLLFEILGNAFLYHMVRRLVNFQVEIGQGKREIENIVLPYRGELDEVVQGLAPASGLVLKEVKY